MNNNPIGIFDSGLGGLTVLSELTKLLPAEDTIYLGDTAHVPYGTKSSETVTRYSLEIADFLSGLGIKLLVVACNTASAYAIDRLTEVLDIPVIGVIEPGARKAVDTTTSGKIGIIGTEGTIRSKAYTEAIKEIDPVIQVHSKACPLFVSLAEEGFLDNTIAELTAKEYLAEFGRLDIDTLVLGCTHYPLLKGVISKTLGAGVRLIDSAEATASEVSQVLRVEGLLSEDNSGGKAAHSFYVTDSPKRFMRVGRNFLNGSPFTAELVTLGS
ncbi:MAG: glutamate racemase [Thermodesulfobacteriota bacterium]